MALVAPSTPTFGKMSINIAGETVEMAEALKDVDLQGDQIIEVGDKKHGEEEEEIIIHTVGPKLNLFNGISVIFGLMVGSGIFSSAGLVYADVGSAGMSLVIWGVTGLLGLTGALCYAELGTMIPGNGGEAPYLERGFGPWATFIFNWTSVVLLKPGSAAIIAVAFGKYSLMTFMSGRVLTSEGQEAVLKEYKWVVKGIALGCIALCTLLCSVSKDINRRSQVVLTLSKFGCLAFVIVSGLVFLFTDRTYAATNLGAPFKGTVLTVALVASAMNHGLWAFEGWNNLNLVAGDLKNPQRNLPLSIWISVTLTIGVYLLTLLAYYFTLPAAIIGKSETVGVEFGRAVLGTAGAIIMPILICICIFGACLSSIYTSAEIVVYAARVGHMPKILGRINGTLGTPMLAFISQAILAACLVLMSDFDILVHIYTFPAWIFYGGCVVVLLLLRWREPHLARPYKVWITTPIAFLLACILLIVSSFYAHPLPIGLSFAVLLLGLPVYYFLVNSDCKFQAWIRKASADQQVVIELVQRDKPVGIAKTD